uniref:Uncharacterized protein n=1 Tax=Mycena chlorophos TaxID=658473 RepID=A0ABQ0LCM8_MYCCL|nr:predicted protein [Mycena chlorophos]
MPAIRIPLSDETMPMEWLRAGFLEPQVRSESISEPWSLLSLVSPRIHRVVLTRRTISNAFPVAIGAALGAVGLALLSCIAWIYYRRRRGTAPQQAQTVSPYLVSRPFLLDTKLGRSRLQPAVPAPVEIASPHRRRRRRNPVTPPAPIIVPPIPPAASRNRERHERAVQREQVRAQRRERARQKAERKEQERDVAERTVPVGRRRSSTSKSVLGRLWHLPPISEGYGVGLMTRESLDFRRLPSYYSADPPSFETIHE